MHRNVVSVMQAPGTRAFRVPRWVDVACWIAGIGLLVFVVARFPFSSVLDACKRVGPTVAVLPLIAIGWYVTNACGLHVLLDRRVPRKALFWNRFVGEGYNAVLPLAGFGGEPFKLRHLATFVPPAEALTALVRDRLIENAIGYAFSAVWLAASVARFVPHGGLHVSVLVYAAVAGTIAAVYLLTLTTRLPGWLGTAVMRRLGIESIHVDHVPVSRLAHAALWYLAGRWLGMLEVVVLFAALGLPRDTLTVGFTYNFLQAAGFIGFFLPQGLGVLEGASTWLFSIFGFPAVLGVAFVLARRGRLLLVALAGVVAHALARAMGRGSTSDTPAEKAD